MTLEGLPYARLFFFKTDIGETSEQNKVFVLMNLRGRGHLINIEKMVGLWRKLK